MDPPGTLWAELCRVQIMRESPSSVAPGYISPFQPDSHGFATPVSCLSSPTFCKGRGKALNILRGVLSGSFPCPLSSRQIFSLVFHLRAHRRASQHSPCPRLLASLSLHGPFFLHPQMCLCYRYTFFLPRLTQFPLSLPVTEQLLCVGMV